MPAAIRSSPVLRRLPRSDRTERRNRLGPDRNSAKGPDPSRPSSTDTLHDSGRWRKPALVTLDRTSRPPIALHDFHLDVHRVLDRIACCYAKTEMDTPGCAGSLGMAFG